jgi:threonine synthase
MTTNTISAGGATHLECTRCGAEYASEAHHRLSQCCEKPLYPRYDLEAIGARLKREDLRGRPADLWRYAELLPVRDPGQRRAPRRGVDAADRDAAAGGAPRRAARVGKG